MTIFGSKPPFAHDASLEEINAVKRYVKYVVDRYGAYVDFWELMNEAQASTAWYTQIAKYLRSIDPYHHPIATSLERPDLPVIDINGQHWDERSAVRMRIRTWTAFFAEGTLIFWNTSATKTYRAGAANIYLGPEERGYLHVLQRFTRGFDPRARIVPVDVSVPANVRGYGLSGPREFGAYLHAFRNQATPTTGVRLTIQAGSPGSATWIDPADGRVLARRAVTRGAQQLIVPPFNVDVALKIRFG